MFEENHLQEGTVIEAGQASLVPLEGLTVTLVGYGTMGRAQAHNLRRSGISVVLGCRDGSASARRGAAEGFTVMAIPDAVAVGQIVMLMLPDQVMAEVYESAVRPHLRPGAALGFAHGFALAFDQIRPEPGRPCFLVAPKAQGDMLLEAHRQGGGVPSLLAVAPEAPPETWDLAAAYALASGCLAGGGFVTTFARECVSDQFGEQAVLCGGVVELVKAAFDILVEAGYGQENAYFECVHELKLITDLLHRHGIEGMRRRISPTAAYGGLTRGPFIVDESVRGRLRAVLAQIESGKFAQELLDCHGDPERGTAALAADEAGCPLAQTGRLMLTRLAACRTEQDLKQGE